ncbi:fatty acid desaturase [Paraconexibacter antarcticus]|jgi:stearoyl-CoA desaturase (delta-9 desaturase)|uniref:Fatty acid desaturase n=1 Tax=Paraconexibacter antarcticus TaxID=2949664 RepID=A0ABY5DU29_9ACTN|nr:fatty acid desaturase [Paraconexibacter antarcticus]UTI65089.1 fatty acid desaturase [Paraconexibacter antarcticus]
MTRAQRYTNIAAVVLPFAAFFAAVIVFWNEAITWRDVIIMVTLYVIAALGITIGYHRMLTHRAFQAKPWVSYTFAIMGSMGVQGPVINWVADHRKHHAHTDEEGDPHSPHVGPASEGVLGPLKGLYHAHIGWLFSEQGRANRRKYAPDLMEDPGMKAISRNFHWIALGSLALPALLGFLFSGFTLHGALTGFLWGGLVRVFFLHHVTWSINSICHFFGTRRFGTEDHSTNVAWLALPSMGEAWHHNHHAFPRSAQAGLRGVEKAMDPSMWVINGLERLGLVWNVVRITPERQAEKQAQAGGAAAPVKQAA